MAAGYIYVLANSSMPGLLKVGKTTRLPSERVAELSGATGVPVPFIVAFEQFFSDCGLAEDYVHLELERRGFREASNREFFRASANEVIRIILQAPGLADGAPFPATRTNEALWPAPREQKRRATRLVWESSLKLRKRAPARHRPQIPLVRHSTAFASDTIYR